MIVTCPYCNKKMRVGLGQLLFRGRLSVACPACKRQVYAALRAQLVTVRIIVSVFTILAFFLAAQAELSLWPKIGLLTLVLVLVLAVSEALSRYVSRDEILRSKTEEYMKLQRELEASREKAERLAQQKASRHPRKK